MKSHLLSLIKVIIGPLLIVVLLYMVGVRHIWQTLQEAQPTYLLVALIAYLGTTFLRGKRWQVLLNAQELYVSLPRLIYLDFMGSFFNLVLPSSVGGDVVKFYELSQQREGNEKHLQARIASSLLADRICGLLILLLMGAVMVIFLSHSVARAITTVLVTVTVASLAVLFLLLNQQSRLWVERLHPTFGRLLRQPTINGLYASLDAYKAPVLLHAALISFLFNILIIMTNIALGLAFGVTLALPLYFVFIPLISLIQIVPFSSGGLGVRESGYLFFLGQAGVAEPIALAMGLAYYACTIVTGLIGGGLYLANGVASLRRKVISAKSTEF